MVQNLITTVPTGTHQFPARNHRPTGLWYMVKHHPPIIIQICSSRCAKVSQPFPIWGFVVHSGQHFPYLQNRFEPKPQSIFTVQAWTVKFPKWEYDHSPITGGWLKPTSEIIYCSRGHFDLLIQVTNFIT